MARRLYTVELDHRGRRFTVSWGSSAAGDFVSKIQERGTRRASGRERYSIYRADGRIDTSSTKFDASWHSADRRRQRLQDEFYRSLLKAAEAKRNAP